MRATRLSNGTPVGCEVDAALHGVSAAMPMPTISRPWQRLIERRHLMRQQYRVAQRRQQDGGAELGLLRAAGDGGQQGERIVARLRRPPNGPDRSKSKPRPSAFSASASSGPVSGWPSMTRSRVGSRYPSLGMRSPGSGPAELALKRATVRAGVRDRRQSAAPCARHRPRPSTEPFGGALGGAG